MHPLPEDSEKWGFPMTQTTQTIFDKYEVRKSKKQKTTFIQWVVPVLQEQGYPVTVETGKFGVRNIVIGDIEHAKVVFTAHYDTCAVLPIPNFIAPKNILCTVLYQLFLVAVIFAVVFLLMFVAGFIHRSLILPTYYLGLFGMLLLMLLGPANRHTANDNTSGVTGILDLAQAMPEELRDKAAFVLFDLEEAGLIGSACFARAHKTIMQEKLLVNFDCISDGNVLFLGLKKGARKFRDLLEKAFVADTSMDVLISEKNHFYPSDQEKFPCGVGVASLKKTKFGLLYLGRIHTRRDTVYQEGNINFVVNCGIRLTEAL